MIAGRIAGFVTAEEVPQPTSPYADLPDGLEADATGCAHCETAIGVYLSADPETGYDRACWGTVFRLSNGDLVCEDCAIEAEQPTYTLSAKGDTVTMDGPSGRYATTRDGFARWMSAGRDACLARMAEVWEGEDEAEMVMARYSTWPDFVLAAVAADCTPEAAE